MSIHRLNPQSLAQPPGPPDPPWWHVIVIRVVVMIVVIGLAWLLRLANISWVMIASLLTLAVTLALRLSTVSTLRLKDAR